MLVAFPSPELSQGYPRDWWSLGAACHVVLSWFESTLKYAHN